jgi:hypothetical protein
MILASRVSTEVGSWLERGEHWLRPADQLDCLVRRRLIPIRFDAPAPRGTESPRNSGILTLIQIVIGENLRAMYDVAQPIPPQLGHLLQEFERASPGIARTR